MNDIVKQLPQEIEKTEKEFQLALLDFVGLFIGALAVSLAAIFMKIGTREISATALNFNRFWIATLAFGLWYGVKAIITKSSHQLAEPQQSFSYKELLLLLGAAFFLASCLVTWAWSFNYTTIAHSCLLHYQHPIFTALGAWLIFGKSFDNKFLIGLVLTVLGGLAIGIEDIEWTGGSILGDGLALLSGVFFSAELLIIEQLRGKLSTTTITTSLCLFGALVLLPVALLMEGKLFPVSWLGWISAIALGLICQVAGHWLLNYSLKKFSSGFVAICVMVDIVVSAFLAWIIFFEPLTIVDCLALPIVFLGIYLASIGKGAKNTEHDGRI